jgi:hypothetical protein
MCLIRMGLIQFIWSQSHHHLLTMIVFFDILRIGLFAASLFPCKLMNYNFVPECNRCGINGMAIATIWPGN